MMVVLGTSLSFALLLVQIIAMSRGLELHGIRTVGTHFLRRRSLDDDWKRSGGTLSGQDGRMMFEYIDGAAWLPFLSKGGYWPFHPRLGRSSEIMFGGGRHLNESQRGGQIVTFTPRLGRRDEEKVFTETSRSPPFAPRLGRVVQFSPEFGKFDFDKRNQLDAQSDDEK